MASLFPFLYPIKTRVLNATSTSSGTVYLSVVVPARGKVKGVTLSVGGAVTHDGASTVDFQMIPCGLSTAAAILGTTIAGMGTTALGGVTNAITTTTAGSFYFEPPVGTVYVNPGDILAMNSTGIAGPTVSWVISEF